MAARNGNWLQHAKTDTHSDVRASNIAASITNINEFKRSRPSGHILLGQGMILGRERARKVQTETLRALGVRLHEQDYS